MSRSRIVAAYDARLVGMLITPRDVRESRAESVRRDGYKLVSAPELVELKFPGDATLL